MNFLSQFIDSSIDDGYKQLKTLPLIHTTDLHSLRDIIVSGMIIKNIHCQVFDEELSYFFYGKAAYTKKKELYSSFSAYYPITFIIKPPENLPVKRIYPFDTGAFEGNLFEKYVPEKLLLSSFELNTSYSFPESAKRLMYTFYDSNLSYYKNEPRKEVFYDKLNFEVQTFLNLISSKESSAFDERNSTIEVQINQPIHLNQDTVLGVILPKDVADSKLFSLAKERWLNAKLFFYSTFRAKPEYFSSVMVERLGEYLEQNDYFTPLELPPQALSAPEQK